MDKKVGEKLGDLENYFQGLSVENFVGVPKNENRRSTGAPLDITFFLKKSSVFNTFPYLERKFSPVQAFFFQHFFSELVLCNQRNVLNKNVIFWKSFLSYFTSFGKLTRSFFLLFVKNSLQVIQLAFYLSRRAFRQKKLVKSNFKKVTWARNIRTFSQKFCRVFKTAIKSIRWTISGKFFFWEFYFYICFQAWRVKICIFWAKPQQVVKVCPGQQPKESIFVDEKVWKKMDIERQFSGLSAKSFFRVVKIAF